MTRAPVPPLAGLTLCALALLIGAGTGCVIELPVGTVEPAPLAPPAQLDILLVVDNSGSMCEEQIALNEALFGPDCPIQSLNAPGPYANPSPEVAAELEQRCGLTQMLAAYELDFRLGVITTDVGPCDNRYRLAETQPTLNCYGQAVDWGRRPQRGCLQSASTWPKRWLTRDDGGFVSRLREGLAEVGTQGSTFERGLDAVDVFLDPSAARAPGCERDAADFLRPGARLVVIFITDEDDCSHGDGAFGLPDENAGESCSHATEEFYMVKDPELDPGRCYSDRDQLAPVAGYAERWRQRTRDQLSVFVLGGVATDASGQPSASGCLAAGAGAYSTQCRGSRGSSSFAGPGQPCDPAIGGDECCTADAATRYMQLLAEVDDGDAASICGDSVSAFKRLQAALVDASDVAAP